MRVVWLQDHVIKCVHINSLLLTLEACTHWYTTYSTSLHIRLLRRKNLTSSNVDYPQLIPYHTDHVSYPICPLLLSTVYFDGIGSR